MADNPDKQTMPRRGKWRRRILAASLIALALLLACLPLLNGPVFRATLEHFITVALQDLDPDGDVSLRVEGTILKGPTIHDLQVKTDGPLASLQADHITVTYSLRNLIRTHDPLDSLELLSASGLKTSIDLTRLPKDALPDEPDPDDDTPPPSPEALITQFFEQWQSIFDKLGNFTIDIPNVQFDLIDPAGNPWSIANASLERLPGKPFNLELSGLSSPPEFGPLPLAANIQLDHSQLLVHNLFAAPDLGISSLSLRLNNAQDPALDLQATLHAAGASLDLNSNLRDTTLLNLNSGSLNTAQLMRDLENWIPALHTTHPLSGNINKLDLAYHGQIVEIIALEGDHQVALQLAGSDITWAEYSAPSLEFDLTSNLLKDASAELLVGDAETFVQADLGMRWLDAQPFKAAPGEMTWNINGRAVSPSPYLPNALKAHQADLPDAIVHLTSEGQLAGIDYKNINGTLSLHATKVIHQNVRMPDLALHIERPEVHDDIHINTQLTFPDDIPLTEDDAKVPLNIAALITNDWTAWELAASIDIPDLLILNTYTMLLQQPWSIGGHLASELDASGTSFTGLPDEIHLHDFDTELVFFDGRTASASGNLSWTPDAAMAELDATWDELWHLHLVDAEWHDERLTILHADVHFDDNLLISLDADMPLNRQIIDNPRTLLDNDEPWNINITPTALNTKQIQAILDSLNIASPDWLKTLDASLETNFALAGSPSQPLLNWQTSISNASLTTLPEIEPVTFQADIQTTDDSRILLRSSLTSDTFPPLSVQGHSKLALRQWLDDPESLNNTPITANASFPKTNLNNYRQFIPFVVAVQGTADIKLSFEGTVAEPHWDGTIALDIPRLDLNLEAAPTITNASLLLTFADQTATIETLRATIDGGRMQASGNVNFPTLLEPEFNLHATADALLVYRSHYATLRTDADLRVQGTLQEAHISGTLSLVESLFIRDIDPIPLRLPRTTLAAPELPEFAAPPDQRPIQKPFTDWTLDVTFDTKDPFLVRSNLATADITGQVHVGGTLDQPEPTGNFTLGNAKATLPYSEMRVTQSNIEFRPEHGLDPLVNIQAISNIRDYRVRLYFFGPTSDTRLVLTSNPPLPEHEILTLIAAGATSSELEGGQLAAFQAARLVVDEFAIFGTELAPPLRRPLIFLFDLIDDVDITVGQRDPLTGRERSSATIHMTDGLRFVASVDREGNQRGVLAFIFRFR